MNIIVSAEFQIIAQIRRKNNAIKDVPEPSPLYPSSIFDVFAKKATIKGATNG